MTFNETQIDGILDPLIANAENAIEILTLSDSVPMSADERAGLKYALWETLAHARLARFVLDMGKQKKIVLAGV